MLKTLYPYQQKAVKYLHNNKGGALFMSMRLGKSVTVIDAFKNHRELILIVCPKSVIPSWWKEIEEAETDAPFDVINYEQLKNYNREPNVLILDESTRLRNPQAQITKLLFKHFIQTPVKVLLSGNPAPNTPLEYFTQMAFINNGEWMGCKNYWQFRNRYFSSDYMGYMWFPKPKTNASIRENLFNQTYQLTRKQAGILDRKIYEIRYVEMPKEVKKIYKKLEKEFVLSLPSGDVELNNVLPQINYLQQVAGGFVKNQIISDFKVREVKELAEGELKGEPTVIWTNFRYEQFLLQSLPNYLSINGDTPLEERKKIVSRFNEIGGNLVITESCGKYGLNLSKSSTAIYFSNSYSWDDRSQSEDRILHLSKKEPLLYVDVVTKDTIQEQIIKTLCKKDKQAKYFMSDIITDLRGKYVLGKY